MMEGRVRFRISEAAFEEVCARFVIEKCFTRKEAYYDFEDGGLLNASHYLRLVESDDAEMALEFLAVFRLEKRDRWYVERDRVGIPCTCDELTRLLGRLFRVETGDMERACQDVASLERYLHDIGVTRCCEVVQRRFGCDVAGAHLTFCEVAGLGHYVECDAPSGGASVALEQVLPTTQKGRVDFGEYVDAYMDGFPELYYSTRTKARLFCHCSKWNLLEKDGEAYDRADHAKTLWVNIHFRKYDLYAAHYIDNLCKIVQKVEHLFFVYWDNLIYPESQSEEDITERNINALKLKLDKEFPGRYTVLKLSDVKRSIDATISRAIEKLRYFIDSEVLRGIIDISKPSLNIQVINNMIEDFVLCCFSKRFLGYQVDVYYTGSRFLPMEPVFRKCLYGHEDMHFPELSYVYFPPYFDDFARRVAGDESSLLVERTISSFFHLYPSHEPQICEFYGVDDRVALSMVISAKLAEARSG